ncbi:MAG TPA: hypothetical protein VME18_06350 [Acidobacteriaceae bacterium]|nr:hypothetical protein [Acidobacteriaceae bacterium]
MQNEFRSSVWNVVAARALTVFGVGAAAVELMPAAGFRLVDVWVAAPLLIGAVLLALFATVRVRGEEIECRWLFRRRLVRVSDVKEVQVEIPRLAGSLRVDRGKVYFLLDGSDGGGGPFPAETPMLRYLKEWAAGSRERAGS